MDYATTVNGTSFTNTGAIAIPGPSSSVAGSPAAPYPSHITVSGLSSSISKVTVTLSNLSHTFPDDLDLLVVGPSGGTQNLILMSDVGGNTAVNSVTLTLDDAAGASLPDAGPLVGGTFKPTNASGTGTESFPSPAPAPSANTTLAGAFQGADPNGVWRLYVTDDASGDVGTLGGWSLNFTLNPTPTPTPTRTPTATPASTGTPTRTPTATATMTVTSTPSSTSTATPSPSITSTSTQTPIPASTATGTPTATATPFPRPQVGVAVAPSGAGRLLVTVTARDAACSPNNQLQSIQFTRLDNAIVEWPGAPAAVVSSPPPPTPLPVPGGQSSYQFMVTRPVAGSSSTVSLVVTDGCGTWQTFVGGGPGAF